MRPCFVNRILLPDAWLAIMYSPGKHSPKRTTRATAASKLNAPSTKTGSPFGAILKTSKAAGSTISAATGAAPSPQPMTSAGSAHALDTSTSELRNGGDRCPCSVEEEAGTCRSARVGLAGGAFSRMVLHGCWNIPDRSQSSFPCTCLIFLISTARLVLYFLYCFE